MVEEIYPIRAGDFIACPPGGRERAYKVVNTGAEALRNLAVSTKMTPEELITPPPGSSVFSLSFLPVPPARRSASSMSDAQANR